MAVDKTTASQASRGRRFRVGSNVLVACALVVAIVVVAQTIAFNAPKRWDMTSSRVNSLGSATESLLGDLDGNIRITSLYFETDREDEDQPRYRRAAQDLIDLYEATNRSKISAEWVNPLKNHDRFRGLLKRLREKTAFKNEIESYRSKIAKYTDELDARMRDLLQSEIEQLRGLGGEIGATGAQSVLAPIENELTRWSRTLEAQRERVDALSFGDNPQLADAANEIRSLYRDFANVLQNVGKYGAEQVMRNANLPADQTEFLQGARPRYADLVSTIEVERTALQELEPLAFDDLTRQLAPTSNALLIETDDDAKVVDFSSVWPPIQKGGMGVATFKNRAFKGEEKLTSAILRITHKEQTAVVFVRYGGPPLFSGGFMPGQPPAMYSAMKQQIEDANFVVKDWDVKTKQTQPEIHPAPTRTIYVVLKPTAPQRGPMGQPSQEPPFAETHRRAVLGAIGANGRALFVAGWYPGPFGPIPSTYEYDKYLNDDWGIKVDTSYLLMQTMSIAPGKYVVARRDFYNMQEPEVSGHDIVSGKMARALTLPWCSPLELADNPPEGVELHPLVELPRRDGVWGIKNIQAYQKQLEQREYLTRVEGDREGPFDLAVAATQGDAKLVVVSARDFASDAVALAREMSFGPQGISIRSRNPGNCTLLINSLHWLNDNMKFMDLGRPIDSAMLEVGSASTVKAVQALTIFVWPMVAAALGCVAWWVRRR